MPKKIIEDIIKAKGIKRVTTYDERWYIFPSDNPDTGLPGYDYDPSVTWIAGCYPKGIKFYKWLADHGWDEAEAIKSAAGDKGSKVHYAITDLILGKELNFQSEFLNPSTGKLETLTNEEWECLMAFREWFIANKPKVIANEVLVRNKDQKYAGTIDLICELNGKLTLIDFKTGQYLWPEHELQLSGYKHGAPIELEIDLASAELATLQIGYRRNKSGYKLTEIEDKFDLFLAAQKIWANEHGGEKPSQKDLPLILSLAEPKAETKEIKKIKKTKKQNA